MKKGVCSFLCLAFIYVLSCSYRTHAELVAAYNETANYDIGTIWPYSIGYLWEAPIDFNLTGVETKFAFGNKRVNPSYAV